jgi:mutator protein MutT
MSTIVRVVAGALFDARGRVLIAQRPAGRHLAGRWEFPGGKVGSGESDGAALERELREELGVVVRAHEPLMSVTHDYEDRSVELNLHVVSAFEGEVRGLDGQQLKWVPVDALGAEDLLEADRPFVAALRACGTAAAAPQLPPAPQVSPAPQAPAAQQQRIAVRNPRTGAVDFDFVAAGAPELAATAATLRAAQSAWREAGAAHRVAVMQRWRSALLHRRREIVGALSIDTGRVLLANVELQSIVGMIDRWCEAAPRLARESEGVALGQPNLSFRSQFVPYGLVGVISPWNYPLTLSLIDAIPALLAGCAALVKPSEVTPRFIAPLAASVAAVPELAAVLAFVQGGAATGAALVDLVDVVCFTGSVETGRKVAQAAARRLVPAFLELGGKDPLLVTASADVEVAADVALRASCVGTGQACQSIERIYVHRSLYERFVERLVAKARAIEPNWPDLNRGTLGPFIFARQADVVAAQIAEAVARGARVLCGGTVEDHGGKWLRPTVLVDVDHSMKIMTEETFGPVMPVMPFDDIEQGIALANEGEFGLSAAVVAGSLAEAEQVGRRLEAGGISLNDGALTALCHDAEKQSFKSSGLGASRMGPSGFTRFLRTKALIRQSGTPVTLEMMSERALPP